MNCANCGSPLPPGAAQCPVCGFQQQAPYGQQPVYPQYQQPQQGYQTYPTYTPYQQGQTIPGYQQPYIYGQTPPREKNSFLTALSELPQAFLRSFVHPAQLLRSMMEKQDLLSAPIVAFIVLLLAFLGGMVIIRSFVGLLFSILTSLGANLAGGSAAMNQGITYITGRIAPAVGGIAALCQLMGMIIPTLVFLAYLCLIRKVMFSWELALGMLTVSTLPTAAFALLAMLLSLLSPWPALLAILCSMTVSYVQLCGMLSPVTSRPDEQLLPAKIGLVCTSLVLTLLADMVVGGLLMGRVMQRVLALLYSVGSLL